MDRNFFLALSTDEIKAQYANLQTSIPLFLISIIAIVILLAKGQKRFHWYYVFITVFLCGIPTVLMHGADYGAFQPGILTEKLLFSFFDISFVILMADAFILAFLKEFCSKKAIKNIGLGVTLLAVFFIGYVAVEVFGPLHDRPLWIGGNGAPMDGTSPGLSIGEFGALLVAIPIIPLLIFSFKKMDKTEIILMVLSLTFMGTGFYFGTYGDHEIPTWLNGLFLPHSMWHLISASAYVGIFALAEYRIGKKNPSQTF